MEDKYEEVNIAREGERKRNQKSLNILSAYSDCNDKSWVISLVIYFMSVERDEFYEVT